MSETVDIKQGPEKSGNGKKEPSSIQLVMTLGLAGFFSGIVLVGAYFLTLPMIQANTARALERAIYKVLPGCQSFTTLELNKDQLAPKSAGQAGGNDNVLFAGYGADGNLVGFAIPAQETGFQDVIVGLIGYDPAKKMIVGFEVLESKETPGLGDKIFKDADFRENFKALAAPGIVVVKKGEKTKPNEVEAITGATISSKAVVRLLNKGLGGWEKAIESSLPTLLKKEK